VSKVDFERLQRLWQGRRSATSEHWHELYALVEAVLGRARIMGGLDRADLIQGYFCDRVLAGTGSAVPHSEAALLSWFRNYQYDQAAKEHDDLPWEDGLCETQSATLGEAVDTDAPLFREQRRVRIDAFFATLSDDERLLLQVSHCDDESVLSVQQQYRLRSAHYRSKQLGIALGKSSITQQWAQTKIGRLVAELGLRTERTMTDDLLQVFRLLCERARQWWEAR
jgi:hypothetical protein